MSPQAALQLHNSSADATTEQPLVQLLQRSSINLDGDTIRLLQIDDLPTVYEMFDDPQVNRYLPFAPNHRSVYQHRFTPQIATMLDQIKQGRRPQSLLLAVLDSQQQFAGVLALLEDNQPGHYAFAYQLRPAVWGQGLATKAVRWLRDLAFNGYQAQSLVADCYDDNQASKRVLEKSGFGRTHKEYGYFEGNQDRCWFAIDRQQWQRSQAIANS